MRQSLRLEAVSEWGNMEKAPQSLEILGTPTALHNGIITARLF